VPRALINPYCFAPAIAPHIAAQQAAVDIQFAPILEAFQQLRQLADVVIVEGAGGWLVPLNATQTIADLALALQIPVLLVVRIRLGCINHALLSAQAIQQSGLTLLGWVANCIDEDMPVMQENISTLKKMINAPCLAVVGKDQMPEFDLDI
jgi:dethiobiotin synthetase